VALAMAMDIISQTIKRVLANLPKAVSEIPGRMGAMEMEWHFTHFSNNFWVVHIWPI
jgi:hypothetical protein